MRALKFALVVYASMLFITVSSTMISIWTASLIGARFSEVYWGMGPTILSFSSGGLIFNLKTWPLGGGGKLATDPGQDPSGRRGRASDDDRFQAKDKESTSPDSQSFSLGQAIFAKAISPWAMIFHSLAKILGFLIPGFVLFGLGIHRFVRWTSFNPLYGTSQERWSSWSVGKSFLLATWMCGQTIAIVYSSIKKTLTNQRGEDVVLEPLRRLGLEFPKDDLSKLSRYQKDQLMKSLPDSSTLSLLGLGLFCTIYSAINLLPIFPMEGAFVVMALVEALWGSIPVALASILLVGSGAAIIVFLFLLLKVRTQRQ